MRILIVKLSAIGDVVQALSVLAALRKKFTSAEIDWVVGEAASDLLVSHPMLDDIIIYPRRRLGELSKKIHTYPALFAELAKFTKKLRRKSYDIILDLQGLLKSGLITCFAHGQRKIGFAGGREMSSLFLSEKLPPYDRDEHAVKRYLRLASYLGADESEPEFPLFWGREEREKVGRILREKKIQDPFFCLIPGTVWKTKQWIPEGFARVADFIVSELNGTAVVVGGAGDKRLYHEIQERSTKSIVDLTGQTDLCTLAALFKRASCAITTDTGPMHLAAATGIPVVALFGPTAPWRTGPYGKGHRVIHLGLPCSPCFNRQCDNRACMTGITPDQVIDGVRKVLQRTTL